MKKIIAIILSLCLVVACVGCGKNNDNDSTTTTTTESTTEKASSSDSATTDATEEESKNDAEPESESESESETESTTEKATEKVSEKATEKKETTTAHTHSWKSSKVAAACTTKGYTLKKCSCGETEKTNYVNALGHSWGDWETIKAATTSATGTKRRTCSRCGETESQTIPKISMTTGEKQIAVWEIVNEERAAVGLSPLAYRSDLQEYADIRAQEIAQSFSHTRPNGDSCFSVFDDYNGNIMGMGENIAYGYPTPEEVMEGWMNSSGHKSNILGSYNGIVVGVYGNYWVQLFIYE